MNSIFCARGLARVSGRCPDQYDYDLVRGVIGPDAAGSHLADRVGPDAAGDHANGLALGSVCQACVPVVARRFPGLATLFVTSIIVLLAARTGPAAESARAEAWLARLAEAKTNHYQIKFQRRLPTLGSTNQIRVTVQGKKAIVTLTPVDWFLGFLGHDDYLVCNSLSPDAAIAAQPPAFRAFRWAVGFDTTNYWFINQGANLTFCSAAERVSPKESGQQGRDFPGPPPRSFGLALHSVVTDVLHLGIPAANDSPFTVHGHQFVTQNDSGDSIKGYITPGSAPNVENIDYTVELYGEQGRIELRYDASLSIPDFPSVIERNVIVNGQPRMVARYEIADLHAISPGAVRAAAALPSPGLYATNGTALWYSNGVAMDLRHRTFVSFGYAGSMHPHRRGPVLAVIGLFFLVPAAYACWRVFRRRRLA